MKDGIKFALKQGGLIFLAVMLAVLFNWSKMMSKKELPCSSSSCIQVGNNQSQSVVLKIGNKILTETEYLNKKTAMIKEYKDNGNKVDINQLEDYLDLIKIEVAKNGINGDIKSVLK